MRRRRGQMRLKGPPWQVYGAKSFLPGGKGLAALRAALKKPAYERGEYQMYVDVMFPFFIRNDGLMKALKNIEAAGFGHLRIERYPWGIDFLGRKDIRKGSGAIWTQVVVRTTIR